jgi:hypothetical protein
MDTPNTTNMMERRGATRNSCLYSPECVEEASSEAHIQKPTHTYP